MSKVLKIENLHVAIDGKEILKGVDLTIKQGEVHALMGPNGSGKSTLSYALMGHPNYEVTEGSATLDGVDLISMRDFRKELRAEMDELGMDPEFARRYLNEGFSGGEKKRAEVLQL